MTAWLLKTPNYSGDGTNVSRVQKNMSAIAIGLLAAAMTYAVVYYWLAGTTPFGATGGFESAEGLRRGVGAAIFIAAWPWIFDQVVALANVLSSAVIGGSAQGRLGHLLIDPMQERSAQGAVSLLLMILLTLASAFAVVGLMLLKIAMLAALAVAFVGMPIAVGLWPFPPTAWVARKTMNVVSGILLIPVGWAVVFATYTALFADSYFGGDGSTRVAGVQGAILGPLVTISLGLLLVSMPFAMRKVVRSARAALPVGNLGGAGGGPGAGRGGSGMISRAAAVAGGMGLYMAARAGWGTVAQHLPESRGGQKKDPLRHSLPADAVDGDGTPVSATPKARAQERSVMKGRRNDVTIGDLSHAANVLGRDETERLREYLHNPAPEHQCGDRARRDRGHQDPARQDTAREDPARQDTARQDTARQDTADQDRGHQHGNQRDRAHLDCFRDHVAGWAASDHLDPKHREAYRMFGAAAYQNDSSDLLDVFFSGDDWQGAPNGDRPYAGSPDNGGPDVVDAVYNVEAGIYERKE